MCMGCPLAVGIPGKSDIPDKEHNMGKWVATGAYPYRHVMIGAFRMKARKALFPGAFAHIVQTVRTV